MTQTIRTKPLTRLSQALQDQVKELALAENTTKNEMLETLLLMGISQYRLSKMRAS